MKYLIIVLLLAFLIYALYYFIFRKKTDATRKESGLSQKAEEVKTQSQLLKKQLKEETSDLKDTVEAVRENALRKEEKSDDKPEQSSLLREDLAEKVAETREKSPFVFDEVKHSLQDSAEDMLIKPELFDEGLAQKAEAVKEESGTLPEKDEKITLQFGNTLMESKLTKEEAEKSEAQSSVLREDLAEKILEERKDTLLDLNNATEAELDNKTIDVHQHFEDAQAQEDLMKDDIGEIEKETVVVKKFVRKDRE